MSRVWLIMNTLLRSHLSAVKRMLAVTRLSLVPLLIGALLATVPAGCRKKVDAAKVADVNQSLAALRKQLDELKTKFVALREKVESIPPQLEGFNDARARFYATEEGRGVTDGKTTWLASRLEAAVSAGNNDELQAISKDIAATYDDIRRLDEMYVKLLHQMMAFERMANKEKAEAAAEATASAAPASPKAKRPKSKP
jgi:hypothetical protein